MDTPVWIAEVRVADGAAVPSVRDLLRAKMPLDLALRDGAVYVDADLGYAIGGRNPADGWPAGVEVLDAAPDVKFRIARDRGVPPSFRWLKSRRAAKWPYSPPFVADDVPALSHTVVRLGGWPQALTGLHVPVAVLDSGIADASNRLLRRADHSDFNSAEAPRQPPNDMDIGSHGTRCAGVIGLRSTGPRTSAAPDCELFAGQITSGNGTYSSVANILLMLTWAHEMNVRVANLSFSAVQEAAQDPRCVRVFGKTVARLREKNHMLVFAVAEQGHTGLCFPGSAPGVVAVGLYQTTWDGTGKKQKVAVYRVHTPAVWLAKGRDLLFGPGDETPTVDQDGTVASFSDLSAGCAFVSGVAALYLQKYATDCVNDILARMSNEADPIAGVNSTLRWPCVRFPT